MIVCSKCGKDNELGRVFCTSCGTKLDLTHMSKQAIAQSNKESWLSSHWKNFILVPLILIVLAVVGLVLWPNTELIGGKPVSASGGKVERMIASLANLKAGQRIGPYIVTEQELNGYLEAVVVKKANLTSMKVKLSKELVTASIVKVFAEIDSAKAKIKVPIAISCDAKCVPVGGKLKIAQASIGHMKLFGPLRKVAEVVFGKVLASAPNIVNLNAVDEIKVDDGKVSVFVSKK